MVNRVAGLAGMLKYLGRASSGVFFAMFASTCLLGVLPGCVEVPQEREQETRRSNVTCVVIGMEVSQRFGSCPGCRKDSDRMASLLRERYGYPVKLLQSEAATRLAVMSEIRKAVSEVDESGLFILYYSGHGGQEYLNGLNTSEPSGADSKDEYLCLYDDYLLDDEIWETLSKCRGRVFCIFDACHSETMFRSVVPEFVLRRGYGSALGRADEVRSSGGFSLKPRAVALERGGLRMLCWSGCMEKEYSYGGITGGVMTNAILDNWKRGKTYSGLWLGVVKSVQREQPTQHPKSTQYGSGFDVVFQ